MLRNIIGPSFDSKKCVFLSFFRSFFFKISFSLQEEEDFWKTKKKKQGKIGPSFDSKKGYFWTKFWLYSSFSWFSVVCTKMHFSPFLTQLVSGNFCKKKRIPFLFFTFLDDHLKKHYIIGPFGLFPFCFLFCFFFLFLCLQHRKDKQTHKMQLSFRKPHFWHPNILSKKTLFWHDVTQRVCKHTQKTQ